MSWLPEFTRVIAEAVRVAGGPGGTSSPGLTPLPLDPERPLAAFPGGIRLDDPDAGTVEDAAGLQALLADSERWLSERRARVTALATTIGPTRAVGEYEVELGDGGRTFILPIAVVAEVDAERASLWVRVYHSHWPLLGRHVVRPPLLDRDPDVRESDVVGEYQAALATGDAARIVATFEPDGCFREPAGPAFRVCGSSLSDFFERFFSAGGGIILEHCSVTEDGVRTVLEFNAVRWGGVELPPQAGLAVYERGSTGRIREARIYDDVEGPVEG